MKLPLVLIIDDDVAVRTSLKLLLDTEGFEAYGADSPEEALDWLARRKPQAILLDMNFTVDTSGEEGLSLLKKLKEKHPQIPVVLITGWGTIQLAVEGMKLGAADFINKPWENTHLLQVVKTAMQLAHPQESTETPKRNADADFSKIVGKDAGLLAILETISRIAKTDASVLILGESGTGKELIAEAIHQNSLRKDEAFVKVNLGGISSTLFESELFGHKKGAFTDAKFDRKGRFELAQKGTIFLDEIGDLDHASQVKLLRVLQDRTYEVLGSSQSKTADVRVICATNKDLAKMVGEHSFREDLFYRINLITLKLPPLRERADDIPLLAEFFVSNLRAIYQRPQLKITKKALSWLRALPLKGNIRQLKNLVERTVLLNSHDTLDEADFKAQEDFSPTSNNSDGEIPSVGTLTLEQMEIEMIKKAMDFHKSRITKVAQSLGITRSALYRRLEKHGIPYDTSD